MDFVLQELTAVLAQKKAAVLCIVTETSGSSPRKAGAKMLLTSDQKMHGTVGGGALELKAIAAANEVMQTARPVTVHFTLEEELAMGCGGAVSIYFEKYGSGTPLYIFGAGHVGKALAKLAPGFGFDTNVIDPRQGIFNSFPNDKVAFYQKDYLESIADLQINEDAYVVIMTPEHKQDELLLRELLPLKLTYLGMMGSKRKVAQISEKIVNEGVFTADQLGEVRMPIGVEMRCEQPAEIALSILAQMIDTRNALIK